MFFLPQAYILMESSVNTKLINAKAVGTNR